MSENTDTLDLETVVSQFTDSQATLAQLLRETFHEFARETGSQIDAVKKHLDTLDVITPEALSREHYQTGLALTALSKRIDELDTSVHHMRDRLEAPVAEHITALEDRITLVEARIS